MPEIVPADRGAPAALPVVVRRHPFESEVRHLRFDPGTTIADVVDGSGIPDAYRPFLRVYLNDHEVPAAMWPLARPKAGTVVYVAAVPMGNDNGKNPLATILSIGLVIVTAAIAPAVGSFITGALGITVAPAVATAIGAAVVGLAGSLLMSALIPPPKLSAPEGIGLARPAFQLTGTSNRANPYGPIPRVFGRRRVFPLVAARPFTESAGNQQYLRLLLCVGYGPLRITDIRIGQTPISAFEDIEVQVLEGTDGTTLENAGSNFRVTNITLYSRIVREEALSIELTPDQQWYSRFSQTDTNEISIDITLPRGLVSYDEQGSVRARTFTYEVQWRPASGGAWSASIFGSVPGTSLSAVRTSTRFNTGSLGQWEVRVRRTSEAGGSRDVDQAFWSALRSINGLRPPVNERGLCLIAMRIRASEQLNGVPDQINCIAESWLPTWSQAGGWTWTNTRNPAWAYLDLLRRRGREILLQDSRLDLVGIRAWASACNVTAPNADEPYWRFDGVIEGGSIFEAINTVASHGRASFTVKDGKYSVVRDVEQTVPVQHITPRNSWGYSGRKTFIDLPHALRVRFVNAAKGYVEDERIVYDDGRDVTNSTRFETIELPGCTSPTQAWRDGRYFLAVGQLRPEEHQVTMDIEALRCTLGDLVRFSYDTVSIGLGSGRLTGTVVSGDSVTALRLDGPVDMDLGESYAIRVRREDGSSQVLAVITQEGETSLILLASPLPVASAPEAGDLFMFGEASRESAPMIVKRIEPGPDLTVRLTLVDAQPGVWTADTSAIPDFESFITLEEPPERQGPPVPTFTLRSDETALLRLSDGTLQDRIGVLVNPLTAGLVATDAFEVQFREAGDLGWQSGPRATASTRELFIAPVIAGRAYDVRLRAISPASVASAWTTVLGHVVVGKTTPPAAVTGFTAERRVDGVQLSWNANGEPDLAGYSIRRGPTWDTATTVTERASGTTLFVALGTAATVTFLIRAVDTLGLLSPTATSLATSVSPPASPKRLDAYPQDDRVRLTWDEVPGNGILYEIREGTTWDLGRVVLRAAGSTALVQWPIRLESGRTWWIKALSSAGIYSPAAATRSTLQAPTPNTNAVLDLDIAGLNFPGVTHDATPGVGVLNLDQSGGVNRATGRHVGLIDLGREWYARNWLEMRANVVAGAGLTWAAATVAWQDLGEATWLGTLSDAVGVGLDAYLYTEGHADASLVAGFPLDGATAGLGGSPAASSAVNVTYQPGRWRQGAFVGDTTQLAWPVAVPAQFSLTFDLRLVSPLPTQPVILATLQGPSRQLSIGWDPVPGVWYLDDRVGGRVQIAFPREVGDTLSFCVVQTAGARRLDVKSLRHPAAVSAGAPIAPAGTFSTVALQGGPLDAGIAGLRRANAVIADVAVRSAAIAAEEFAAEDWARPLGFAPRRALLPGDYNYRRALLELVLSDPARTDRAISITQAALYVDVPDIQDRGSGSIPAGGAVVSFGRAFSVAPEVNVVVVGGPSAALPRISTITATGFTVQLVSAANPAVSIAGDISWAASGY